MDSFSRCKIPCRSKNVINKAASRPNAPGGSHSPRKSIHQTCDLSSSNAEWIKFDNNDDQKSSFPLEINTDSSSYLEYCQPKIRHNDLVEHPNMPIQNVSTRNFVGTNDFQNLGDKSDQENISSASKQYSFLKKIGTFSIGSSAEYEQKPLAEEFSKIANTDTFPFPLLSKSNDIYLPMASTSVSSATNTSEGESDTMFSKLRELCTCMLSCNKCPHDKAVSEHNSFEESCADDELQWNRWDENTFEIELSQTCSAQSQTPSNLFTSVGQVKTISFLTQMSESSTSSSSTNSFFSEY
jgi:hypothetical protein